MFDATRSIAPSLRPSSLTPSRIPALSAPSAFPSFHLVPHSRCLTSPLSSVLSTPILVLSPPGRVRDRFGCIGMIMTGTTSLPRWLPCASFIPPSHPGDAPSSKTLLAMVRFLPLYVSEQRCWGIRMLKIQPTEPSSFRKKGLATARNSMEQAHGPISVVTGFV
jgi:hypothetical protein